MPCDHVIELRHYRRGDHCAHDVKTLLSELSRSEATYARVLWTSGLTVNRIQVIVSSGIGRYGYSGFMGTRVEKGDLYVYKKETYDPALLSAVCVGPMASSIAKYMREPQLYSCQLEDLGVFCRWFNREKIKESVVEAIVNRVTDVTVSVRGLTEKELNAIRYWMGVMQYNFYVTSNGNNLIITI